MFRSLFKRKYSMACPQNLSKQGWIPGKLFDTPSYKAHAQAKAAADTVCQTHDDGKADALQHEGIPAPRRAHNTRDENIADCIQLFFYSQPWFEGAPSQRHISHMLYVSH